MKGNVEKIWENETANGKQYWVLQIGDDRYSVWEPELVAGLVEGDAVDYDWKKSGQYKKITSLARYPLQDVPQSPGERKNSQIIRMSCLRSATEILSGFEEKLEKKVEMALNIAKQFESYVREDLEVDGPPPEKGDGKKR
jgi:hypothetical protein